MLDAIEAVFTSFRRCKLSGQVTGLGEFPSLVFSKAGLHSDVDVKDGRYAARLKPGRYAVSYRIFNNFTRMICEVEVSKSREWDIHYESPKMTVKISNLPAGTQGGMVFLRDSNGNASGRAVERLAEFQLDF